MLLIMLRNKSTGHNTVGVLFGLLNSINGTCRMRIACIHNKTVIFVYDLENY